LLLVLVMFWWGARVLYMQVRPPADTLDIDVIGKQWMWKVQHPDGTREINELHVPRGERVQLTIASEDVIHSFYLPSFRMKQDAVPGRYTKMSFEATRVGEYHLFCAEYCGTKHSAMIGRVVVMEPTEYQAWLSGGGGEMSLAARGERMFQELACHTCHLPDASGRGPSLQGLFGSQVKLADGRTVTADEGYVRESILNPQAKLVAGYQPLMPTFQGLVNEEALMGLIEYVKSLPPAAGAPTGTAPQPATPQGERKPQ
jgi:cytochrome c oxidase subunit 2